MAAKKKKTPNNKKPGKNQWADHLTQRAKNENYPARSVYKLEEIQNKFQVLKKKRIWCLILGAHRVHGCYMQPKR